VNFTVFRETPGDQIVPQTLKTPLGKGNPYGKAAFLLRMRLRAAHRRRESVA
jgi:hypothetical protein